MKNDGNTPGNVELTVQQGSGVLEYFSPQRGYQVVDGGGKAEFTSGYHARFKNDEESRTYRVELNYPRLDGETRWGAPKYDESALERNKCFTLVRAAPAGGAGGGANGGAGGGANGGAGGGARRGGARRRATRRRRDSRRQRRSTRR